MIHIHDLRLWAHVGVLDHERRDGQWFQLDITLGLDLSESATSDDLSATADYSLAVLALQMLVSELRDVVAWSQGNTDLRLLIGGSLLAPEANGFIVMNDGEFVVQNQIISKVKSSILFDFDRLEVQEFKGRMRPRPLQASHLLDTSNNSGSGMGWLLTNLLPILVASCNPALCVEIANKFESRCLDRQRFTQPLPGH